jgi:hypothetical protein
MDQRGFLEIMKVLTSFIIPQSTLNKCHNALSYHRVGGKIGAGIINFMHIAGKTSTILVMY